MYSLKKASKITLVLNNEERSLLTCMRCLQSPWSVALLFLRCPCTNITLTYLLHPHHNLTSRENGRLLVLPSPPCVMVAPCIAT